MGKWMVILLVPMQPVHEQFKMDRGLQVFYKRFYFLFIFCKPFTNTSEILMHQGVGSKGVFPQELKRLLASMHLDAFVANVDCIMLKWNLDKLIVLPCQLPCSSGHLD